MPSDTEPTVAFEVYVNEERFCVASISGDGVLNTMINHVMGKGRNYIDVQVGGLISSTDEHVHWEKQPLKIGDEVRVKIVEATSVDLPNERLILEKK
jgi:hypothetical protein